MKRKKINYKWFLVWAAGLLCLVVAAWNPYIQYDESYTLSLIQHKVTDVVRITGVDVHPPFYYLFVKLLTAPFDGSIWSVRAFNVLPLAGMFLLGVTIVRKLWGEGTGLWFSFLSVFLPANMSYLLPEMRMYGLASFLVVTAFLMGKIVLEKRYEAVSEKKAWFFLFLSSILAAYTQYYALIAVALVYLWILAVLFFRKQKGIGKWCICVGASAGAYLPWLFVLLGQFGAVREDYWIPPVSVRDLMSYIMFPFYSSMTVLAGAALALFTAVILAVEVIGRMIRRKEKAIDWGTIVYGVFVYGGVIGIGVLVSVLVSPVFSVRYVKCILGILVLCLAGLFSTAGKRKQIILHLVFLIFAVCNLFSINKKNAHNREVYGWMMDYVSERFDDNTVLAYASDGHYMGIFSVWFSDYPGLIPDECWKDEYEAFAPQLMTRSAYEEKYGAVEEKGIWAIDIGNFWWQETWDGEMWQRVEHSEPFLFYDQTDELQCDIANLIERDDEGADETQPE